MHLNCSMNTSINDNVCLEYFGQYVDEKCEPYVHLRDSRQI